MTTRYFTRLMQLVGIVSVATALAVLGGSIRVTAKDKDVAKHEDQQKDKDKDKDKTKDKDKRGHKYGHESKDGRENHERDDRDWDDHGDRDDHEDRGPRPVPPPPPPSTLSCPCWNGYTLSALATMLTSVAGEPWCMPGDMSVSLTADQAVTTLVFATSSKCLLRVNAVDQAWITSLTPEEGTQCLAEATALVPSLSWCAP